MSADRRSFAGAVLAGGESRRMGRDKARLRVGGEPLWRRQAGVLRAAGAAPVVIVRRRGQRALAKSIPHVRDEFENAGPLAGVHAALMATDARWVAVLAVDMPAVDTAWFEWLRDFCRVGAGAVARGAKGFEPLAAIYPREAVVLAARRLMRGRRSMQDFVAALVRARRMKVVQMSGREAWRMTNWNAPEDRQRKERD